MLKRLREKSIKNTMLLGAIIPVVALTLVIGFTGVRLTTSMMMDKIRATLTNATEYIAIIYEDLYPGDYSFTATGDNSFVIKKGERDITGDYGVIDTIKKTMGADISIYRKDLCVLTSMCDENGYRPILKKASAIIVNDVLSKKESKFYDAVEFEGVVYCAYYEPVYNSDGSLFGMYAVSMPTESVRKSVLRAVMPLVIICILSMVVIGIINTVYTTRIVNAVMDLTVFSGYLANGDFSKDVPPALIQRQDEFGILARNNRKMQKRLEFLVEYDALTKIHNRRFGEKVLKKVHDRVEKDGLSYCVCICDIDLFKKVNDTYGHDSGDEVLINVASILSDNLKGKGSLARWGGEEFMLVISGTLQNSIKVLEKTLNDIRKLKVVSKGKEIKVTMSFGVSQYDANENWYGNLKRADELLYYAKEHGRNRVCWKMED